MDENEILDLVNAWHLPDCPGYNGRGNCSCNIEKIKTDLIRHFHPTPPAPPEKDPDVQQPAREFGTVASTPTRNYIEQEAMAVAKKCRAHDGADAEFVYRLVADALLAATRRVNEAYRAEVLAARQQGRREGIEECRQIALAHFSIEGIAEVIEREIRALLDEPVAQPVDKDSRE